MSKLVDELREQIRMSEYSGTIRLHLGEAKELLAHIERLEANQELAIACSRCGGCAENHVTVPREPTPEMIAVGVAEIDYEGNEAVDNARNAYLAMIAAAPTQEKGNG